MKDYFKINHDVYSLNQPYQSNSLEPVVLSRDPGANDKAPTGTYWCNTNTIDVWICSGRLAGTTVWLNLAGGPGTGNFDELTVQNNVSIVAGNLDIFLGDLELTAGNITVTAGSINALSGALVLTTLQTGPGTFTTTGAVQWDSYGEGVLIADSFGEIMEETGTNGQLIIGGGTTPQFSTVTSPLGSIVFTPGAASLGIDVDPSLVDQVNQFDADTGSATPIAQEVEIRGNPDHFETSANGNEITISPDVAITLVGSATTGTFITAASLEATAGDLIDTAGDVQTQTLSLIAVSDPGVGGNIQRPASEQYMWSPGNGNIFIGEDVGPIAGFGSFSGTDNIGMGISIASSTGSLTALTTGSRNIAVRSGSGITTGNDNILINQYGSGITTGSQNIILSHQSPNLAGTSNNNIIFGPNFAVGGNISNFIGFGTLPSLTTASGSIFFGNDTATPVANMISFGSNTGINEVYITGIFGVTTVSATTDPLLVSNFGQLGTISSSARFKENIEALDEALVDRLMDLRPVTFNYKIDQSKHRLPGLIAEEVHEVVPELVNYDKDGIPFSVRYHEMPVLLLAQLQKMAAQVAQL